MPRFNNFDLLRLIFAAMVVLAHCHDLSMEPALFWIPHIADSRFAVEGFFAMSGCLIVASYDRSPSLKVYLEKRARRILPAYWEALVFALVLGTALTTLRIQEFWSSSETWKYILAHLGFATHLQPTLPGLFRNNPLQASVNGALWTIKIEVMFYLFVPVIVALCRKLGVMQTWVAIFVLSVIYRAVCEHLHRNSLAIQLPGQLAFFAIGAMVYYYYPFFKKNSRLMWITAIGSYVAYIASGFVGFRALGVPLIVMCVGLLLPRFQGPTRYGDFSYGTYVLHCPVIQTLVALGVFHAHPFFAVVLVISAVAILSVISWNLVEKPFLNIRPQATAALSSIEGLTTPN